MVVIASLCTEASPIVLRALPPAGLSCHRCGAISRDHRTPKWTMVELNDPDILAAASEFIWMRWCLCAANALLYARGAFLLRSMMRANCFDLRLFSEGRATEAGSEAARPRLQGGAGLKGTDVR
jgi:hypothetical protein